MLKNNKYLGYALCCSLILVVSIFHFTTAPDLHQLHELYEHLYYVPILLSAFLFGSYIGLAFAALSSGIYSIHIFTDLRDYPLTDPLMHLFLYHLMAVLVGFLSSRAHRIYSDLERTSLELSKAYADLKETSDTLRRADRLAALGRLSAGIAHEIRNPLGSVKGCVEILAKGIPPGHPDHEFVKIVDEEIARVNRLIEEFLRFARPPRPRMKEIDVSEVLSSALRLVDAHASNSQIQLLLRRRTTLPTALWDEDQIRQVLLNILLNAIEAMPGGGVLTLDASCSASKELVAFEISDTGDGAGPESLERIFDPFFSTKPQGTGLGLSISHQLVQSHGGNIIATQNRYGGLTFSIELPLRGSQEREEPVALAG